MAKKSGITLQGFDEFYERLSKMSKTADAVATKKFQECTDVIESELREKAAAAGLAPRLVNQIRKKTEHKNTVWHAEVGWEPKKGGEQASDFEKVVYINYGTPSRYTRVQSQHLMLNGRWQTVSNYRGHIREHGFVRDAKKSASKKCKRIMKKTLEEIMNR